ncbi:MAG: flagellar export chaperone FliS [Gammaproteobacteria bacterium]|nr:MAG: flagellar export chaperone FliS [Gammaproteobacteria bacterium]
MYNSAAMNQYKQIGTRAAVETADPHTLVKMLIDGAIERINSAKFFMQEGNVAQKGESISRAISIIDGLKTSLDMQQGGEIAQNLASLYDYMQRQLLQANLKNKAENLDEVLSLMNEIRSGWTAIPQDVRKAHQPKADI